jgi:hypothetical protein
MRIQITEISDGDAYCKYQNLIIGKTFDLSESRRPNPRPDKFFGFDAIVIDSITSVALSYDKGEHMSFFEAKYKVL